MTALATAVDAMPRHVTLLQAGPEAVRFAVDVPAPILAPALDGATRRLALAGFDVDGEPGEAALPARVFMVAVPPTGSVAVEGFPSGTEWHEGVTLTAIPWPSSSKTPPAESAVEGPTTSSAESPVVKLLDVSWLRDQRVARVVVRPAVYDAGARRLGVHRRIEVEVRFRDAGLANDGARTPDRDGFAPIYRDLLINEAQGRSWRRAPSATAPRGGRASLALARRAPLAAVVPDTSLFAGRRWVKIAVPQTGFYRVYFGQLRNSALFGGSDSVRVDSLRLFVWPGTPVLPENSYCDSCGFREVALGLVDNGNGKFDDNNADYFYFFGLGASDWTDLYAGPQDPPQPDTVFLDHPYETRNFYYLTIASSDLPVPGAPKRIVAESGALTDTAGAATPATFRARVHFEQDREFHPDATPVVGFNVDGSYFKLPEFWEKWFWASVNNTGSSQFTETVDLPGLEPSLPSRMRFRVWGLTLISPTNKSPGVLDHYLDVHFGSARDTLHWNNVRPQTFDATMTGLSETGDVLDARVLPTSSVESNPTFASKRDDETGVAWFDVFYPRHFTPVDNTLTFDSDRAGGRYVYDLEPFTVGPDSLRIFDVTDPYAPTEILQPESTPVAGGWRIRFERNETGLHRYRVIADYGAGPGIVKPPNSDVFDAAGSTLDATVMSQPGLNNLRSGHSADYLIIYYDPFAAAAESLCTWRQDHLPLVGNPGPYEALKIPVSALYDQFSGGRTDPGAIRNFLRAVFYNWTRRPTFVTLLGDASSDFKNLTGAAPPGQPGALIPSWEGGFDFVVKRQFATDDWLLNVDDPNVIIPDFLGGRIPAPDEASALVYARDKLLPYERSAPFDEWRDRVMLIADDNMQGFDPDVIGWGHMQQTVALDVDALPPEIDREYVYLHTYPSVGDSKPGARADVIRNIDQGVLLSNYIGHGSPIKLADESALLASDAELLTNRDRPTIFVAASCDVGKFNSPGLQGMGELLLFNPTGGAVGVVSATEQALSDENASLNFDLYRKMFERDTTTGRYEVTVAEGLLSAKTGLTNSQKYQLMGDAALRPNLPRLWVDAHLANLAGSPIDSVARGMTAVFEGSLLDRPGGAPVALDGLAHLLIEDSAPIDTVPNCIAPCFGYRFKASPVFRGDVSVSGGRFSTRFVMPLDAHLGPRGRARGTVTVSGGTVVTDGAGMDSMVVAPGGPPAGDVSGPRVVLSFVGGSTHVRPDATLRIDLFDESGILVTGNAPQNGIIVTVDDNSTQRYDVTPSFRYAANSYQSGAAFFTLPGLALGSHHISVSAADNLAVGITAADHRGAGAIDFEVTSTPSLQVTRALLFPNPIRSGGHGGGGQFVIDAPGDSVDVLVKIYTVSGKMIRSLRSRRGLAQAQIPWDGLDAEGAPLARGVYLFKAQVFTGLDGAAGEARQKADAVGRFVVVGR